MVQYQLVALNWLHVMHGLKLGCILADEMGLGKTVEAISLLAALRDTGGPSSGPHLVVAPVSVLENWLRELRAWCPGMRARKYYGEQKQRAQLAEELATEGFDVLVTSYSYFEGDSAAQVADRKFLCGQAWGVVVFDEAHALKRAGTARFIRLSRLQARQRLLMSGTPVQNSIGELLTMLSFMLPDVFTPPVVAAFAASTPSHASERQVRRVRQLLAPFVLRRTKGDVLRQLPGKVEEERLIEMSPAQHKLYAALLATAAAARTEKKKAAKPPARPARAAPAQALRLTQADARTLFFDLRKVANHPLLLRRHYTDDAQLLTIAKAAHAFGSFGHQCSLAQVQTELRENQTDFRIHELCEELGAKAPALARLALPPSQLFDSAKMRELKELLPRLEREGHRVLLFSQHTTMLDLLERFVGDLHGGLGLRWLRLDGQTAQAERQLMIDEFQRSDEVFIFLLSTRAGGQGINLTAADTVILHDLDWNPQLDRQAVDRAHRMGQAREVRVLRMVTRGTVDENIHQRQKDKTLLDAKLLNGRGGGGGDGGEAHGVPAAGQPESKESAPDHSTISAIILEQLAAQRAVDDGGGKCLG